LAGTRRTSAEFYSPDTAIAYRLQRISDGARQGIAGIFSVGASLTCFSSPADERTRAERTVMNGIAVDEVLIAAEESQSGIRT
jgi:hypothetical protein